MTIITATKRPVTVEAVQYTGENGEEIQRWGGPERVSINRKMPGRMWVNDDSLVYPGDWVIREGGYLEVMPDATFRETYDISSERGSDATAEGALAALKVWLDMEQTPEKTKAKVPPPSFDAFCDALITTGVVQEDAIHDPEGWDGERTYKAVDAAYAAIFYPEEL